MPARPRIFCIPAAAAPVVAVLRRGPTDWAHVGRWDTTAGVYEPGAWLRGTIYPQKCDLSPDGRWLAYSAMKRGADWPAGEIFEAISRLPWLTALAAWEAGTTYNRGIYFDDEAGSSQLGPPDAGDAQPALARYGLRLTPPVQFAVEHRRGWTEAPGTEPRIDGDLWDEHRRVVMQKPQPAGDRTLHVYGAYAAFRSSPNVREPATYYLTREGRLEPLDDAQWADWDQQGRLLVATADGAIEIREAADDGWTAVFTEDLATMSPQPAAAPDWALDW